MNAVKCLFFLAIIAIGFSSCKKDDVTIDKGLVGTWVGQWGFDQDTPTYYERWVIKKNGDLTAYDGYGNVYAEGSCSVNGLNFTAEYTPVGKDYSYKIAGLYHDQLEEILGTWGKAPSATNRGTIEMYRQ